MKRRDWIISITLFFSLVVAPRLAMPQDPGQELARIRRELERARDLYRQQKKREHTLLDELAALDREIDLTRKFVSRLRTTAEKQRARIRSTGREVRRLEDEVRRLRQLYAKRVVSLYKYGRVRDLELLIRGVSLHKVLVWLKFERLLADRDRRLLQRLTESRRKLEAQRRLLELQLAEQAKVLEEKSREEQELRKRREQRAALLEQVRRSEELYRQRIQELETAAQELRKLIGRDVEERRTAKRDETSFADFASLRGKLRWPVRGKVIQGFGLVKHPKFGTVTENLGIDIRAPMGTPVRAVCDGRVTAITWQRARGNIVLLSHRGGYYTVYTHLADIYVTVDDVVAAGDVIGTVGDTGSLNGPKLHFEIWHNTENLNPEVWLKR